MSTDEFDEPTPSWPPATGTTARDLWDMSSEEVDEYFDGPGGR